MSVTSYDSSVAFKQDQIARLGDRAKDRQTMTAGDRKKFEQSPFMQKMREFDAQCWQKFSERDKKRASRDKNFKPGDGDFEAPKAHKYDKSVNYYKALGVDDLATNDEIKKAYRKLSLTYHPDKTTGKSQEEKDEYGVIFLEVKNAYKTLSDDPTRRQYDFDRERDLVSCENAGKKPSEKISFDAIQALMKIMEKRKENSRPPGDDIEVPVQCRLEKFVYGGHKAVKRSRQIKDKMYGGFQDETRTFRVDVPSGCDQPFKAEFRRQGDRHEDQEPDNLLFTFTSKPHEVVERSGMDLRVKQAVDLGEVHSQPYLSAQAPSIAGRHVILWGQNPFFRIQSGDVGEIQVQLVGEGISKSGSLFVTCRLGLKSHQKASTADADASGQTKNNSPDCRQFLANFGLSPPWGFGGEEDGAASKREDVASIPAMKRRSNSRVVQKPSCELRLERIGEPIPLHTKPHSSITLYSSCAQTPQCPLFAVCLSSTPCGKKKGALDWDRLKARLVPALQRTAFNLIRAARGIRPKSIARTPAFPDFSQIARKDTPPVPWKQLGDESFVQGDYWQAMIRYSKRLEELGVDKGDEEKEDQAPECDPPKAAGEVPELAKLFSNRAACLLKIGDYAGSAADARNATRLAPRWAKPWSRLGLAASRLDGGAQLETKDAYLKSVELEPTISNVKALHSTVSLLEESNADAAHAERESGNQALRNREFGLAVATYTLCIARLPPVSAADANGERPDEHALLRAILYSNRSLAFTHLHNFEAAVADGREAVAHQPGLVDARCQLGTALLASGFHQEAYAEFAKGIQMEDDHKGVRKGRNACLKELVLWKSVSARDRFNARFWMDMHRPKGTTRIFALSDLHFDQKYNEDWVHTIDNFAFQDDVLIVAGNVANTKNGIARALTALRQKFRRVFFTVGNHDLQIHYNEFARLPDSMAKLYAIFSTCDELKVDIFPAPVCEGITIVPLLSWYTAEFDLPDPFPDPNAKFDKSCKWPMDADLQVWKYMVKLNEPFLKMPYNGTVLTFSHFLPRQGLPFDNSKKNAIKAVGCEMIDEQARAVGSKLHVFGHSRTKYAQIQGGMRYVHMPLGLETDWPAESTRRLMMVHDGKNLCMQEWGADGEPPLGFVKRVQHVVSLVMPNCKEMDLRRVRSAAQSFSTFEGIKATFDHIGSKKLQRDEFAKDVWPDLGKLSFDATHGLVIVADSVQALRKLLNSDEYKKEWKAATDPHIKHAAVFNCPLGLDLTHEKKSDPTLIVYGLRLGPEVTEDSEEYAKMQRAAESINKLPGIEGKIAVALHPAGYGKLSTAELLKELSVHSDQSLGVTHIFTVAVDCPASFKMLEASKTFGKWKASYEPSLSKQRGGPTLLAFALPLEITATAAAPKPEKKPVPATPAGAQARARR